MKSEGKPRAVRHARDQRVLIKSLVLLGALMVLAGCGDNYVPGGGAVAAAGPDATTLSVGELVPAEGDVLGGETITLLGAGFEVGAGAAPTIRIAGALVSDVAVLSDTELTFRTPPGLPGPASLVVENSNGDVTLLDAYTYTSFPLYAADGKSGVAGNLYRIDASNGVAQVIGEIGYAVTGMAMGPLGDLYATEATRRGALGDARLLRIDPITGAGSVIGVLFENETEQVHQAVADIAFVGERLIGWSQNGDVPVEIDLGTGRVRVIGDALAAFGGGLAHDGAGTLYLAGQGSDGPLHLVNIETGQNSAGPTLSGAAVEFSSIGALTRHRGRLVGVDIESARSADTISHLIEIDPATGDVVLLGDLPNGIDALASGASSAQR